VLKCRQFVEELCDYLDGTSDRHHLAEIERHLALCRKCRIVCETTRQTVTLYRQMWPAGALPADVEQRLMATLEKRVGK
jgi:predicted anti-sigma-YlaC factor YlaD